MTQTTKERILDAALTLFSERGYHAVSVEQIAGAVNIKAPSLYNHFRGKKDIFDTLCEEMAKRYDEKTESMLMHTRNAAEDREMFAAMDEDTLIQKVQELVNFSLHDEQISKFRKLLTIEQFRSPELSELYTQRCLMHLWNYHKDLFEQLMEQDILIDGDAKAMALQYVAPISQLLCLCDRQPEKEPDAIVQIARHIRQFNRVYAKNHI